MTGPGLTAPFLSFLSECKARGEETKMPGTADDNTVFDMWVTPVVYLFFSAIYNINRLTIRRHEHNLPIFERLLLWSGNLALVAAAITLLAGWVTLTIPVLTASAAFISTAAIARLLADMFSLLVDVFRLIRYIRGLMTRLPYPIQETGAVGNFPYPIQPMGRVAPPPNPADGGSG